LPDHQIPALAVIEQQGAAYFYGAVSQSRLKRAQVMESARS
jgi:hypothetical protein